MILHMPDLPGAGTVVIGAKTPFRPGQAGFKYFLLFFNVYEYVEMCCACAYCLLGVEYCV